MTGRIFVFCFIHLSFIGIAQSGLADDCGTLELNDEKMREINALLDKSERWPWETGRDQLRELAGKIENECAAQAFLEFLRTGSRTWDWPYAAYSNAKEVKHSLAKDAFLKLVSRKTTFAWQEAVYRNAALIDSQEKFDTFKKMIGKVTVNDFPATAYETLVQLSNQAQFDVFEQLIDAETRFNWKDAVYLAVLSLKESEEGKANYPKMAFEKLIEKAIYVDWPVSAYRNLASIDTELKYKAYVDIIIEKYRILTTLSTQMVGKYFIKGVLTLGLLTAIKEVVQQQRGVDGLTAMGLIQQSLTRIIRGGLRSIGAAYVIRRSYLLLNPRNAVRAVNGLLRSMGLNPVTLGAMAGATLALTALSPHVLAIMGAETDADVVFTTATALKSQFGYDAFDQLVTRANYFDWPSRVYLATSLLERKDQADRFNFIVDHTGTFPYQDIAYNMASSPEMDKEKVVPFVYWEKEKKSNVKLTLSRPDALYRKMILSKKGSRSDWPETSYLALEHVNSDLAYAAFYELLEAEGRVPAGNQVFERAQVIGSVASVPNEFAKKAVSELVFDKTTIWSDDIYKKALEIGTQSDLEKFNRTKLSIQSKQPRNSILPDSLMKLGMGLALLSVLVNYLDEGQAALAAAGAGAAGAADEMPIRLGRPVEVNRGVLVERLLELSLEYEQYGVGDASNFPRVINEKQRQAVLDRQREATTRFAGSPERTKADYGAAAFGAAATYTLDNIRRTANAVESLQSGVCTNLALHGAAQLLTEVNQRGSVLFGVKFTVVGVTNHVFILVNWSPGDPLDRVIILDPWAIGMGHHGVWSERGFPLGAYLIPLQRGQYETFTERGQVRRRFVARVEDREIIGDVLYEFSPERAETRNHRLEREPGAPGKRTFK